MRKLIKFTDKVGTTSYLYEEDIIKFTSTQHNETQVHFGEDLEQVYTFKCHPEALISRLYEHVDIIKEDDNNFNQGITDPAVASA